MAAPSPRLLSLALVVVALSLPRVSLAQTNLCPSSCGNSSLTSLVFGQVPDAVNPGGVPASASDCAASCKAFPFYQFTPGVTNECDCFSTCSVVTDQGTPQGYIGVTALCGGTFPPACPKACNNALAGSYGWSPSDPAHVSGYQNQPDSNTCAQRCRRDGAPYYQFVATVNLANGFVPGDCDCFSKCPAYTNFSPEVFINGATCACANVCPAAPPPSSQVTVSCSAQGSPCNVNGVQSQLYSCTARNQAPYPAPGTPALVANNLPLTCTNFSPVEQPTGITPACTVLGAIFPGQSKAFYYKNPVSAGPAMFTVPATPFISTSVTVVPTGLAVVLGPCTVNKQYENAPNVYVQYGCKVSNTGSTTARNVVLNCANFNPSYVNGINPDCSIPKTLNPGDSCPFAFEITSGAVSLSVKSFASP